MTPQELALQLNELHETSLKQLYGVIEGHKEYLRGLIQETQEEVRNLTASYETSTPQGHEDPVQALNAATEEELPPKAAKRRAGVESEEATAAERPAKRRGRPPKQPKQSVIAEEDGELQECQQPAQCNSQQQSVSATVVAAETEAEAPADEATSAAAGTRRRPARGRTAAAVNVGDAAAAATTRSTRSRRGAAAPEQAAVPAAAGSGRGRRGRRGAAAIVAPLDAIAEDDEAGQEQQQSKVQQQQSELAVEPAAVSAAMPSSSLAKRTEGYEQQEQQQQVQAQQRGHAEQPDTIDVVLAEVDTNLCGESIEACKEQHPAAAAVQEQAGSPEEGEQAGGLLTEQSDHAERHGSAKQVLQQHADLDLLQPDAGSSPPAAGAPPKTPGFCLAPESNHKVESDTPCFVGHAPRVSIQRQQQQASVQQESAAPSSAAAASDDNHDRTASGAVDQQAIECDSTHKQSAAGLKAPSLSFGQPLQSPLLAAAEEGAKDVADAAAAAAELAVEPHLDEAATAIEPEVVSSMDWKAFVSTMHAGDAPTPAISRHQLRSHSGADVSQQQQSGGFRRGSHAAVSGPAAAASQGQPGVIAQAETAAAVPASSTRITRSSMKQLRSPSLQALQADDGDLAADGEQVHRAISFTPASNRKGKPVRSPRPSLPRSAKRSTASMAALEPATDLATPAEEHQQQQQQQDDAAEQLDFDEQLHEAVELDGGHEGAAEAAVNEDIHAEVEEVAQQQAVEDDVTAQQEDEEDIAEAEDDVFHEVEEGEQQEEEELNSPGAQKVEPVSSPAAVAAAAATDAVASSTQLDDNPVAASKPAAATATAAGSSTAANSVSAWLAATANASAGAAGDKAKQQLEAAKDSKAAAVVGAGTKSNLVSGIRSFVPNVTRKETAPVAAGKVKVKVKALEAAEAARKAEDAKAQERAARQQQQQHGKARTAAEGEAPAGPKPQGTPSGAVAQSKVAAVERAATGLSGSGGAVRVLTKQPEEEAHRPADKDAAQKKAEREAEAAKRAMDKAEREDRMKRAELKRKEDEQKRRQDLAERQRLKEERAAAAAAALKAGKPVVSKVAGSGQAPRVADKATEKAKQQLPAAAASDPSSFKTPAAPKAAPRVNIAAAAGAGGAAAGNHDSPSLTIKVLEPVSTGSKPKGVMGPPAPVGGKTPAAYKTPAPPVSEQEKRNVEALKSSPYVNTGTKRTPYSQQQQQKPDPNSYIISPYRDDDVETPDRSHKPIPDWARSHKLFEALQAQQHTDPDTIFGARQNTCDLANMFADVPPAPQQQQQQQQQRPRVRMLGQRTSSADWSQDRLTWQEEVKYKKDMGYL